MDDSYLSILVKRLRPEANEINAYRANGQILGYAKDVSGAMLSWPTMEEFEMEWNAMFPLGSATTATPELQSELSIADLQAQISELQQSVIDLLLLLGGQ